MTGTDRLCKWMNGKLYRASRWGNTQLLNQVLKENEVDVLHEVTPGGDTALHTAAFYGHIGVARKLAQLASENPEAGTEFLKAKNMVGNTALHLAAREGREKMVKMLVEKENGLTCIRNNAGETALFKASQNGHVSTVDYLLEYTPEEVDITKDGQTPLHVAVSRLQTGVTRILLKKRHALIDKVDYHRRTPLHILALVPLLNPVHGWEMIRGISKFSSIGQMLLAQKISLAYTVDTDGQSPLHLAAKVGNSSLVRVILTYGGDCVHISDNNGKTALHLAVENASQLYETVGGIALRNIILSLAPSLVDCSDKKGQTALDIAIHKTTEDEPIFYSIKRYLIRHGARQLFETETPETREASLLQEGSAASAPQKSLLPEGSASSTSQNSLLRKSSASFNMDILSVVAALIATIAFQAVFSLPGDLDSDANPPIPHLLNVSLFKVFIIFDSLAFCTSFASAVIIIFGRSGDAQDRTLTTICVNGVFIAFTCIAFTFGAAIHLVVARKCMWLAVVVWIMVCYVPFVVWFTVIHGGRLLLEEKSHLFMLLVLQIIGLMVEVGRVVISPLYFVWTYVILPLAFHILHILGIAAACNANAQGSTDDYFYKVISSM